MQPERSAIKQKLLRHICDLFIYYEVKKPTEHPPSVVMP